MNSFLQQEPGEYIIKKVHYQTNSLQSQILSSTYLPRLLHIEAAKGRAYCPP